MTEVRFLYDAVAQQFDRDRSKCQMELPYLYQVLSRLSDRAHVLDLGCGAAEPIARFFIGAGCQVTGVDAAPAMLTLCRERFPDMTWLEDDMRSIDLGRQFDAILAWDSFFHLSQDDQRRMFPIFQKHVTPRGLLLFTSGPRAGVAMGKIYGYDLFHASLDAKEYERLLEKHDFEVLLHRVEDPDCGLHTVWLAQHRM